MRWHIHWGAPLKTKRNVQHSFSFSSVPPPNASFYWHRGEGNILSVEAHEKLSFEENEYSKPVSSLEGYSVPVFVE